MRKIKIGLFAAILTSMAVIGSTQAQEPAKPAVQPQQESGPIALPGSDATFDPNQPIKPNYTVSISVSSAQGPEADLSGVFQVDATGSLQLKYLGLVALRDLTPMQASDKLAAQYKPYIKDPKVSVSIVSVPKPVIFLTGAVNRPGATTVNDNTPLADVLTIIGFTENSDLTHVRVTTKDDKGKRTVKEYDMIKWLKPLPGQMPDESQNPNLNDRDSVYVPFKVLPGSGVVQVEGDVVRPGVVPLRTGVPITLREAVSLAGGPNPTADLKQVSVRRIGVEKVMTVDYDKMESGDPTQDLVLQSDDIVYIQKMNVEKVVILNGAFARPGRLPFTHDYTLTEAISEGGGLLPLAKDKSGTIFRHVNGRGDPTATQVIVFNYNDIRHGKRPDIRLEPGDTVDIPVGEAPKPAMDPLQFTSSLLSIALLVDRLFGRSSTLY